MVVSVPPRRDHRPQSPRTCPVEAAAGSGGLRVAFGEGRGGRLGGVRQRWRAVGTVRAAASQAASASSGNVHVVDKGVDGGKEARQGVSHGRVLAAGGYAAPPPGHRRVRPRRSGARCVKELVHGEVVAFGDARVELLDQVGCLRIDRALQAGPNDVREHLGGGTGHFEADAAPEERNRSPRGPRTRLRAGRIPAPGAFEAAAPHVSRSSPSGAWASLSCPSVRRGRTWAAAHPADRQAPDACPYRPRLAGHWIRESRGPGAPRPPARGPAERAQEVERQRGITPLTIWAVEQRVTAVVGAGENRNDRSPRLQEFSRGRSP